MKTAPIREMITRVTRQQTSGSKVVAQPVGARPAPVPGERLITISPVETAGSQVIPASSPWAIPSNFATKDGAPCGSKSDPYSKIYRGGKCVPSEVKPGGGCPSGERLFNIGNKSFPRYACGKSLLDAQMKGGITSTPERLPMVTISPVETAPTSQQAILSASSGGSVMPSVESQVVAQANGQEIVVAPKAARGGAMAVGAGVGFIAGGPIGAVLGAIIASQFAKPKAPPVAGFDGFFKKLAKKVGGAVKTVTQPVRAVGRAVDVTSSKSLTGRIPIAGKYITRIARAGVATSAAAMTGGLSVVAGQKGWIPKSTFGLRATTEGVIIGAAVGGAIIASPYIIPAIKAGGLKGALTAVSTAGGIAKGISGGGAAEPSPGGLELIESQLATEAQAAAGQASPTLAAGAPGAKTGLGAAAAGAGAGFLLGGPPGAIVGAVAGMIIGRR